MLIYQRVYIYIHGYLLHSELEAMAETASSSPVEVSCSTSFSSELKVLGRAGRATAHRPKRIRHWVETFTDFWASSVLENHTITIGKVLVYKNCLFVI